MYQLADPVSLIYAPILLMSGIPSGVMQDQNCSLQRRHIRVSKL